MINEVTQISTRWFDTHPTYGINTLMQVIPRMKVDGSGSYDAPPLVDLYDDTMEDVVNEGIELNPPSTPCLVTLCFNDTILKTRRMRKFAKACEMALMFCTEGMSTSEAKRIGGYAYRAAYQSLCAFKSRTLSESYRELNGVRVMSVHDITESPVTAGIGKSKMTGIMFFTLVGIDLFS